MEYEKPTIVSVTDAATAIQGLKSSAPIRDNIDPLFPTYTQPAYEADE